MSNIQQRAPNQPTNPDGRPLALGRPTSAQGPYGKPSVGGNGAPASSEQPLARGYVPPAISGQPLPRGNGAPAATTGQPIPRGKRDAPVTSDGRPAPGGVQPLANEQTPTGGNESPSEPRKYRYSTAQMNETKKWMKWLKIIGLFVLFLMIVIAMSLIFNHFFFSDTSDNGPQAPHPDENGTALFPQDKQDIDSACGRSTFLQDDGALCQEACVPQFFKCCDPFDEFVLYNYTEKTVQALPDSSNTTNTTNGNVTFTIDTNETTAPVKPMRTSSTEVDDRNVTFLDGYDDFDSSQCSFDTEIRGCMSYAKCQALAGQIDPAPANLPDTCSFEKLDRDDDACKALCRKLDCCYAPYPENCLAEKFDLCMDYAPCQNLRIFQEGVDRGQILPTAPRELDFECAWAQPGCAEICETANCCTNPGATSCFSSNFMSCLTYSPCTASPETETKIIIPPQFSHVEKPPKEFIYACNANGEKILEPTNMTCAEYCEPAACCYAEGDANCFHDDPLGCVAWMAQCQVLRKEK